MKIIYRLLLFLIICQDARAQVGVNILTPHASAALQVESPAGTMRGMLTPSMTTINRISVSSGTNSAADGLIVYDVNHRMHYFYQKATFKWVSMSPFLLSTSSGSSTAGPSGYITTPPAAANFSVGINKQTPTAALDVTGNAAVSGSLNAGGALNVGGQLSVNGFPVNALVPAGTIVMWHGSTIPAGWAECNGSSGTPDLRGRFIVAAGTAVSAPVPGDTNPTYVTGTTGGENRHTLTKSEIPTHKHRANGDGATITATGGDHTHWIDRIGSTSVVGGGTKNVIPDNGNGEPSGVSGHTHNTSDFAGQTGDGTFDGLGGQSHENRPQFYVLRFIMKL